VNTTQPTPLKVGDLIEAVGYPALGDYTVIMRDAIFQRTAAGPAPEPVVGSPENLRASNHNADLVRLSARLLNWATRPGEQVLELQAGQVDFRATLNTGANRSPLGSLRLGSLLQLTGVMMVEADKNHEPKGFEILLRSPADVVVLELPSWWTVRRALLALGLLAAAVILALGWVAALRRRVGRQTETIRLKYERELALEEQYRDLFENANDLIQCVDPQGRLLYVNPAWRRTLGYSEAEVANLSIFDIIHPNHRQDCRGLFQRLLSGEKAERVEVELVAKSGETVVCEGGCDCRFVDGRPLSTRAIFRNVTERKRAEEARSFLACIVESSDYAIFGTGRDGTIVSWNAAAEALFGYSPDEILGRHVSTLVPLDRADEVPQVLGLLRRGERLSHFETTRVRKDGTRLTVSLTVSPIKSTAGVVVGAAAIAHDISERKRAELELKKAKEDAEAANRAKSEFLANMSHEIRTPMNGVLGMTELVLNTDLTSEQREYLDMVKTSANRLLVIINDILDFSRIEAGKLDLEVTPFCLRESLARIVKPLALRAQQKGLEMLCDVRPEVPEEIVADPTRLTQVLSNLLDNAIKFTNQGEVELRAEVDSQHADGASLHFAVRDTGIGIPQAKQKSIFEAFTQADGSTSRRFGGTGLGLTISTRLVELMGGRIWVESEPGRGSCFHFTAQVGLVEIKPPLEPAELARLEGLSVLVADDNAPSRHIVAELLKSSGMKPVLAASGAEALTRLEEAQAANASFDLMILDCHTAQMSGFELAEEIRQRPALAGIPILMLTSAGLRSAAARCRKLGIAAYLTKPVNQYQLVESIRAALGRQAAGGATPPLITHYTLHARESKLRVLLAEDNAVNQRLAVRLLKKQGHSAVVVRTGRAALKALDEQEFDLVLMDVRMPDMNALEAAAAIREREKANGKRVPIIAMTAHAMAADQQRYLAAGVDGYVTKPVSGQTLAREINRVRTARSASCLEPALKQAD
jgi:PAS domain S-box-containing protein